LLLVALALVTQAVVLVVCVARSQILVVAVR
jgi:hypothetical protein